jgi:hypothetical protein
VRRVTLSAVAVAVGLAQGGCELVVGEGRWSIGASSDAGDAPAGDEGLAPAEGAALEGAQAEPDGDGMDASLAVACLTKASACDATCVSDEQTCTSTCGNDKGCAHDCQKTFVSCQSACAQACSTCAGTAACGDAGQRE